MVTVNGVTMELGLQIPNFSYRTGIAELFPTVIAQAQKAEAAGRSRPSLSHGPLHFLRRPRRIAQNSSDSRAGSVSIDLSGRCHRLAS